MLITDLLDEVYELNYNTKFSFKQTKNMVFHFKRVAYLLTLKCENKLH